MRAALSAAVLSIAANAQSTATTNAMTQAMQSCQTPITALYANQACAQQISLIGTAFTGIDSTSVANFCATGCFSLFANAYASMASCLESYRPTMLAALKTDGVANAEVVADAFSAAYRKLPQMFNLMCLHNEKGEACVSLFARMGTDLAAATSTPNISTVCDVYYNTGCCLKSLDELYTTTATTSFITSLKGVCPIFENFNPPKCVAYGQTAVAVTAKFPVKGLLCSVYNAQSDEFKQNFQTALKRDLEAAGISASFTTIKSFVEVNGVCNVEFVIRAGTDAATRELKGAITAASTSLPLTIEVAATASTSITSGPLTMEPATVSEATVTGQPVGSSGKNAASGLTPSFALITCFALLMKFF